jgi:hypothetical protein
LRAIRLILVTLAAAAGGSALGAALVAAPLASFADPAGDWFPAAIVFLVSLPFTLVGAGLLTGLSLLWRDSLTESRADYGGIVLAALPVGALMPAPFFGAAGLVFGALFAAITAILWSACYRRFALPPDMREPGHA